MHVNGSVPPMQGALCCCYIVCVHSAQTCACTTLTCACTVLTCACTTLIVRVHGADVHVHSDCANDFLICDLRSLMRVSECGVEVVISWSCLNRQPHLRGASEVPVFIPGIFQPYLESYSIEIQIRFGLLLTQMGSLAVTSNPAMLDVLTLARDQILKL